MVDRHMDFVRFICKRCCVTLPVLSQAFRVKARTIRSYVRRANESLGGIAAIIWDHHEKGYRLAVYDRNAFDRWILRHSATGEAIPDTPRERVRYLIDELLSRVDWITLEELSRQLFVSRASISADLKSVETALEHHDLHLQRKSHYGIRVIGSEMNRRLCLAELVVGELAHGSVSGTDDDRDNSQSELIRAIADCVDRVLDRERFEISSFSYQNLIVHLAIAVIRIRRGKFIPLQDLPADAFATSRAHEVAQKVAGEIARKLSCNMSEEEIGYITIHLAGKRIVAASAGEGAPVITDDIWQVVSDMLDVVFQAYRFDFRSDLELRMNLACHIIPLSVRLRCHLAVENPMLSDIKQRFPLAYSMASDAAFVLARAYETEPSEDETGFVALAFALAIERQKTELPKKRILVVCASGQGSAKLLEHRFRREFASYLASVDSCDVAQLKSVDFERIDYVFTTVQLPDPVSVPVYSIGYFLEGDDAVRVRGFLAQGPRRGTLSKFFVPSLFLTHLRCADKKEVLDIVCKRARAAANLTPDFESSVERREQAGTTAFGNLAALPHPMKAVSDRTFVVTALLDEAIEWGGHQVQAVFLIIISREGHDELELFYQRMAEFLMDAASIQKLLRNQTYKNLMSLVNHRDEGSE